MRTRRVFALGFVALLTALCGCGGGGGSARPNNGEASKPAAQILSDAAAALRAVHSLRMQGTVAIEKLPTAITLALEPPAVSITMQQGSAAAAYDVVSGTSYIKANTSFYEHQAKVPSAVVSLIANHWFKVPPAQGGVTAITKSLDLETLSRCLVENHGTLHVGETTTINGQPAVVVVDKGDRPGSTPNKLYVATTGAPLPLRDLATGKQRPGGTHDSACSNGSEPTTAGEVLTFSAYNQPLNITAPAGALDFSQVAH